MARKLPWSADGASNTPRASVRSAKAIEPKKEKRSAVHNSTTPEPPPERSLRSPSTSPVRPEDPIPEVELMRDGLHADDRYIMVEDEFEMVAKQFTAHLHAAEYERLKRKAREAPLRTLPALNSEMSEATKLKLEQKRLLSRQNTALSEFGKRVAGAQADSDGDEAEEAKVNDPWSGTSLAGLMGEGSQAKTSLMGLDRISHATRAARGYGREHGESPGKGKRSIQEIFEEANRDDDADVISSNSRKGKGSVPPAVHRKGNYTDTSTAERRVTTKSPQPPSSTTDSSQKFKVPGTSINKAAKPLPAPTSRLTSKPTVKRSLIDDLDEFDDIQPAVPTKSTASKDKSASKSTIKTLPKKPDDKDVKKDRRARLDEVPVFLF